MLCIYCFHTINYRTPKKAVFVINGFSVCALEAHMEAARSFTKLEFAITWLNNRRK